jgi:two-component system OmpR family response regulator
VRILLVEDDPATRGCIRARLARSGHVVEEAGTAVDGLWAATEMDFDAVVLDRGLPDGDGLDVLRDLREAGRMVPVVLCTAASDLDDRVDGLMAGADDYLPKPFALRELEARLHAVARRGPVTHLPVLRAGDVELDPAARTVRRRGRPVALRPRELAVLELLLRRVGEVVSRTDLLDQVWDGDYDGGSNVVDVHVRSLRRKLEEPFDAPLITTVRGHGYKICRSE